MYYDNVLIMKILQVGNVNLCDICVDYIRHPTKRSNLMFLLKRDKLKEIWKDLDLPGKPPNTLKALGKGITDFAKSKCTCQ